MARENQRETIAFVCPTCLITFQYYKWEVKGIVPKCCYCGLPLVRVENRR